jgi:hypothetical protein
MFLPRPLRSGGIVGITSSLAEFSGVCGASGFAIGPSRSAHNHNHGFDIQQFDWNSSLRNPLNPLLSRAVQSHNTVVYKISFKYLALFEVDLEQCQVELVFI